VGRTLASCLVSNVRWREMSYSPSPLSAWAAAPGASCDESGLRSSPRAIAVMRADFTWVSRWGRPRRSTTYRDWFPAARLVKKAIRQGLDQPSGLPSPRTLVLEGPQTWREPAAPRPHNSAWPQFLWAPLPAGEPTSKRVAVLPSDHRTRWPLPPVPLTALDRRILITVRGPALSVSHESARRWLKSGTGFRGAGVNALAR